MTFFDILRELTELPGPSGHEERVMDWLRERWGGKVKQISMTPVGNLIAHVGGSGPRLMIQAHADEIGFVVRSIDEAGFLRLASAQRESLPGKRFPVGQPALVLGRTELIEGVFGAVSGHVQTEEQWNKHRLDYDDFFVDLGVSSREEALALGVHVGARVIWNPPTRRLGKRIYGKAMDDRMPLALMTQLLEDLNVDDLAYDLYYAVTVQEENGLIGANSLFSAVEADLALALDVGLAGDIPSVSPETMPTKLGGGPTLVHKDDSVHYTRELIWHLVDIAEREEIPIQHVMFRNYGSDAAQLIRHGIPSALIAPVTRYTHSPFEMIDEQDMEWTLRLLNAFVTTPAGDLLRRD